MIRAGIRPVFKTTGQTGRVSVGFLANAAVPLTGDNVSPASEIARFVSPARTSHSSIPVCEETAPARHVRVVDIFVKRITRHRQLLAGGEVNLSVAPGFGDVTRHR